MARVAFLFHDDFHRHVQGSGHPERPERTIGLMEHLPHTEIWSALTQIEPQVESRRTVELVHSPAYVELVHEICDNGGGLVDGVETGAGPASYRIALRAVGAVRRAIDAVMTGEVDRAFCAVRPPGHHAMRERAMGFCLFNNVAIGARYAQKRHDVERVLVVDWDFHHGNGTQAIFWRDPTVFVASVHCYGPSVFPLTGARTEVGAAEGIGYTLNVPLPPESGPAEYARAFDEEIVPAADRFLPDLVLVSAGFDAHKDDPLSRMWLREDDFAELTRRVVDIAGRHCGGRIVSVLEGGYNPRALALSVERHLRAMAE